MFPARFPAGRAIPAAFATAGVVALASLTACGSSTSASSAPAATGTASANSSAPAANSSGTTAPGSSGAGTGTVTGNAASALAAKAFANTQAAQSVRVAGQAVGTDSNGQRVSIDLTLVRSVGCTGTIALSKALVFKIVQTGGTVWLLPSTAFYQSVHLSKEALALVQDKYIRVKATDSQFADLAKICTTNQLIGALPKPSGTSLTATPTTFNGQSAYAVTQAGNPGTAYISSGATPVLLQVAAPGKDGGTIRFTDYNATKTITPPSDGRVHRRRPAGHLARPAPLITATSAPRPAAAPAPRAAAAPGRAPPRQRRPRPDQRGSRAGWRSAIAAPEAMRGPGRADDGYWGSARLAADRGHGAVRLEEGRVVDAVPGQLRRDRRAPAGRDLRRRRRPSAARRAGRFPTGRTGSCGSGRRR